MKRLLLIFNLLFAFVYIQGQQVLPGVVAGSNASGPSYGPELLTDGTFTAGTDWTFNTGWTYDSENDEAVSYTHLTLPTILLV